MSDDKGVWPPPPDVPAPISYAQSITKGIIISNVTALGMVLLNFGFLWLFHALTATVSEPLLLADPIVLSIAVGLVSAFCWRKLDLTTSGYWGYSFVNTLVGLAASAIVLREGSICLLIGWPLVYLFVCIGSFIGRSIFHRKSGRLNFSLVPLVLFVLLGESLTHHACTDCVTDTVTIHARPSQVWRYIGGFSPITAPPNYWLFRMGLPYPIQSTISRDGVGASRQCILSHGVVFGEKVVESVPGQRLTFDIVRQPTQPEIFQHLTLLRGQFQLRDNGDGTTTLIGRSWYRLPIYPVWYYNPWARAMIRQVHLRVMSHIKTLAETQPNASMPSAIPEMPRG